ncbi:HEAT repeat domain-containing protein [Gemmatimonadota bacterium]
MNTGIPRTAPLLFLALVFTVGLTFATVELPYLLDGAVQGAVATPDLDSHADAISRLKTELFMAHYQLRAIGYVTFGFMVLLIVAGFATNRTGLAALGGVAFMLPVFAQFAAVMFFLAGLGLLNVVWLPVLDISSGGLASFGTVARAPFDLLRWLLGLVGINGFWPLVLFFIGAGSLIFLLGTYAWLSARARGKSVADFFVYRLSRHPQYLGWIVWSYGVYLLLLRGHYPRRSWGISAGFPWLVSTMVIIGVAMLEELKMRRRHGDEYETYRRTAPFLFPLPRFVERLFAAPFRIFFGHERPERGREVAVVIGLYAALLFGASALFYGGGWGRMAATLRSDEANEAILEGLANRVREEPNERRKYFLTLDLVERGEPAVGPLLGLLQDEQPSVRALAAEAFIDLPSDEALPALMEALGDSSEDVRWRAARALAAIGSPNAVEAMVPLLDDPEQHIRTTVLRSLALLGAEEAVLERAPGLMGHEEVWIRIAAVESLGALGSVGGVAAGIRGLRDEHPAVRRSAVVALLQIGSPEARPALERATEDEDWEVRVYAAEALERLGSG